MQRQVQHLVLIEGLAVLHIPYDDALVFPLLRRPLLRGDPVVRHHKGVQPVPPPRLNNQALVVFVELRDGLVPEGDGVLVHVRLNVPYPVLVSLCFLVVCVGSHLAAAHQIGHKIDTGPEAQLADLKFLDGGGQLVVAGDVFDLRDLARPARRLFCPENVQAHRPPLLSSRRRCAGSRYRRMAPIGGGSAGSPVPSTFSTVMLATSAMNGSVFRLFASILP